jgi:hypothetical protein
MLMTSQNGEALLYLDVDHALAQIGDVGALRDMLPMLQELLERDVPLIEQYFAQSDVPSANALLHSLKGCMPIFCKSELCKELAELEHATKSATYAHAAAGYAVLRPKLDVLRVEVERFLAQSV